MGLVQVGGDTVKEISGVLVRLTTCKKAADDATSEIKGGGHRVPPAGLPIEQVLGGYSLSFLRRDIALFVSTRRARDSF